MLKAQCFAKINKILIKLQYSPKYLSNKNCIFLYYLNAFFFCGFNFHKFDSWIPIEALKNCLENSESFYIESN